jgi:hypothetical protein
MDGWMDGMFVATPWAFAWGVVLVGHAVVDAIVVVSVFLKDVLYLSHDSNTN